MLHHRLPCATPLVSPQSDTNQALAIFASTSMSCSRSSLQLSTEATCACSPVTTFLPLIIVLGISIVKEAIEDFGRYRADREVNNRKVAVFSPAEGRFVDKAWKLVQVRASPCSSVASAGVSHCSGVV